MKRVATLLAAAFLLSQAGCGGGGSGTGGPPPPPQASVTVSPSSVTVRGGSTQPFSATVTGTSNTMVNWAVNGVIGGDATLGTINTSGLFTAPLNLPNPANLTIQATSVATGASGTSAVTLQNAIPQLASIHPSVAGTGTFTLTVAGDKFVNGAQILVGGAPVTTTLVSSTQLRATITANTAGNLSVAVSNPNPGSATSSSATLQVMSGNLLSVQAAARFLEQSTFGPTAESVTQLRQVGFTNYLNDQFNAPSSVFADPEPDAMGQFTNPDGLQRNWWTNALYGPDQLRQRAAFALHKIWVVSWVVVDDGRGFVRYLRMHQAHAFGNYRQIMENVTKDPAMGRYQDIANNDGAANRTVNCNENYGRELMQLFTLGLWKLNPDGTLQRDAQNQPIPAYDPVFTVEQNACAMTGWTYAKQTPQTRDWPRPINYSAPLEAVEEHHDKTQKTLIDGFVVPAGGTAQQDLTLTLDNIFNHPNIGPFVAKLLIQQFVTSNPSPAYVGRVAQAFASGTAFGFGSGQRGDMKAVLAAILLDAEARAGDSMPPDDPQLANNGKLKEPVLYMANLLRAVGAQSNGNQLSNNLGANMGQRLFYPPTVFSYFSPEYGIPGTALLGPELNIQTTATTFQRINFANTLFFGTLNGTTVNFDPFTALAANPDAAGQLYDVLNALMLRGTMTPAFRASLKSAVDAVPVSNPPTQTQLQTRARTALYLVAASSQYQTQQ